MQPYYTDYFNNLLELHNDLRSALAELPQEALDWSPQGGMNSLAVLVVHLTGAQRYWLGDVLAGEPSARNREAEFTVSGISLEALLQRLAESEYYSHQVLERLSLSDLEQTRISPRNNRQVSVGWALAHVLKHTALHLGHAQITRQLWDNQNKV